jgi:flagella basal body P-ring formation protein FlgA
MARLKLLCVCAGLLAGAPAPFPASAATLRVFRLLPHDTVRLSDLFAGIASVDRVLGAAPAPGERIQVRAPQLAAIARDYGVDWRPVSGAEQATLERESTPYTLLDVTSLLRPKLTAAGAPEDAAISLPDFNPPLLAKGSLPRADITDFVYDPAYSKFSATVTLTTEDTAPVSIRVAGEIVQMVDAAVLTQKLRGGSIITEDDVRAARLPAAALRGETALSRNAVLGLALRRDFPAGQALALGDLTHPILVARNANVQMQLNAGAIALSAEGIALEDGAMGAHIRVQNPNSHAVMLAEITGADQVRIMPNHTPVVVAAQ